VRGSNEKSLPRKLTGSPCGGEDDDGDPAANDSPSPGVEGRGEGGPILTPVFGLDGSGVDALPARTPARSVGSAPRARERFVALRIHSRTNGLSARPTFPPLM